METFWAINFAISFFGLAFIIATPFSRVLWAVYLPNLLLGVLHETGVL